MSKILAWPEQERPRERLLTRGANHLSNAELLAILLRSGSRGQSAVELARDLLNDFGSLQAVLNCSQAQFCRYRGCGPTKYAMFRAAAELITRCLHEELNEQDLLSNHKDVLKYLRAKLMPLKQEVFVGLFLDNRNRLIAYEELSHGTFNQSAVYPREVVKRALAHNAASVIFAHNHPSGHAKPSMDDRLLTQELQKLFDALDIKIYDHFIIADDKTFSFAEHGII